MTTSKTVTSSRSSGQQPTQPIIKKPTKKISPKVTKISPKATVSPASSSHMSPKVPTPRITASSESSSQIFPTITPKSSKVPTPRITSSSESFSQIFPTTSKSCGSFSQPIPEKANPKENQVDKASNHRSSNKSIISWLTPTNSELDDDVVVRATQENSYENVSHPFTSRSDNHYLFLPQSPIHSPHVPASQAQTMKHINELNSKFRQIQREVSLMQREINLLRSELRERTADVISTNPRFHAPISSLKELEDMEEKFLSNSRENADLKKSLVSTII